MCNLKSDVVWALHVCESKSKKRLGHNQLKKSDSYAQWIVDYLTDFNCILTHVALFFTQMLGRFGFMA